MKNGKSYKSRQEPFINNAFGTAMHKQLTQGLTLAFKKLVKEKRLKNSTLAFSENGKIIEVKAKDIRL